MLKEFKEFALKGNIMDMAVGVVIGGAFQKIVNSLVNDIIMPAISMITGNIDFSDMAYITANGATIAYGSFITTIVDFLIIAFSIFIVIKYLNKLNKLKELGDLAAKLDKNGKIIKRQKEEIPEEPKEPETKICPYCLTPVKYHAKRCPHCTSELEEKVEA